MGSIPIGGIFCFNQMFIQVIKRLSQLAGFEPTRAEPIGFQVQRLNHSATTASFNSSSEYRAKGVEMRGIEPRAFHMQSERSTTELHPLC